MKSTVVLTVLGVALVHAITDANGPPRPLPGPKAQARLLPLVKAPLRLSSPQEDVTIDGINTTIGLATAYYFNGILDDSWNIMGKIVDVLLGTGQEGEVDYFEVIRTQVQQVVGDYIDAHNMDQLEVYKDSLGVLLQRYMEAPVESSTYADKNKVANSLSTSIIANRFLVEAGERPESMIIHFADIASIHILVLQDAAEIYSKDGVTSQWWVDLNDQLDHYINHGKALQNDVVDWRNDMVTCSYDEGGEYDEWTITDPVAELTDTCKQIHGTASCDDHCQAYQVNMNQEVSKFVWQYMGKALREWETLKLLSSIMANKALGFPDKSKQRDLYLEWVRLCRRTVDPSNTALVCSAHFRPSMVNTTMHHAQLREGAIPELVDLPSHLQVSTRTRSTVTSTSADLPVPMPQPGPSTEQMHTEHAYPLPAEVTPDSRISELGTQVESLRRKLKNTKAREKRAKETTQSLLKELEEKNLINAELEVRLESYKDIPCDLFQKPTKEYSAAQKNFALTLHLYSSKAYRYTRETKGINLPEPRTLRRWLEKYDAQPGLNGLMMNSLAAKAKENPADYTLCSMMLDGMSIKQKMEYDAKTNKTVGFVDLGAGSVEDVEAKEALVVMLVGLKANWKCAIAYYFTKGMSSEQQTELVKHCLDACHEANLRVCSLTMDGHSTNKGMAKLLGCRLKLASSFCPSFDYNGHKIHLYFDACHMVKLVRNTLEAYSVIVGPSGRIVWQFIKDLHTTQEDIGLRLGNKLTPDHIDFKNKKMKVKLAVQVLSSSVASALEFLQSTGMYSFSNAGPTVEFIRRIDRLFDVLNSRSPYGKGTKQPIRTENWAEIKTFLLETKDYLTALKTVEGIPLHTSVRGTCIVGLCMDIVSTIAIVEELMLPKVHGFNYFLTYRTSQDHLELFFCAVRQCGGSSNNPTAGQFTSIFRRLLARTGRLLGSAEANVKRLDDTALLDGTTSTYVPPHDTNAAEITREEHNYAALHKNMGILVENIVVYIAGWVIKKAIDQLRCEDCRISLVSDTSSESSVHYQAALKFLSMKNWSSKLHVPSDGVIAILLKAEQHLRDLSSMKYVNPKISLVRLQYLVLRDVDPDVLCLHSHVMDTAQGIDNHSYDLVRLLVKIYFNVRYYHVARLHTQKFQARSVRQKLNKLVLFKGQ